VKKSDIARSVLSYARRHHEPVREKGMAFAPTNIALCKYWGKRDTELNLPINSSLSIALPDKGAMTTLQFSDQEADQFVLNGALLEPDSVFVKRAVQFLDLFRQESAWKLNVDINVNIAVAAGLASSACGFASLTAALNDLLGWELPLRDLSILARLGSGSASRSLWNGFVEWHAGSRPDGMDSHGEPLQVEWSALRMGILPISQAEKSISSRDAMLQTVNSSLLYQNWNKKAAQDLLMLKKAIKTKNFSLLGGTAESNALNMHATMLSSWPPICYFLPETIAAMQTVWELRRKGIEVYFTQDAGPNLKLLFLENDKKAVLDAFPALDVVQVFEGC
jgi:diphosphomevalonate decarboxylase